MIKIKEQYNSMVLPCVKEPNSLSIHPPVDSWFFVLDSRFLGLELNQSLIDQSLAMDSGFLTLILVSMPLLAF